MVGALLVRTPEGLEFAIGSGLTDALRQTPPEIGTDITYRYNGYTSNGIPRFARFLRVRQAF
jgi:DNA ligase-1